MDAALPKRLADLDWPTLQTSLRDCGYALTRPVLTQAECNDLAAMYHSSEPFRSHIVMARYRFGRGEYKYFDYPLPPIVQELRERSYPYLVPVANEWNECRSLKERFPAQHADFLAVCGKKQQTRATPLILHYDAGDFNCLHQDLYGAVAFPLQLTCFLSQPGVDYEGGEFVLVEQRPRAQSKAEVIVAQQGQILIFATRHRAVKGSRGYYRVTLRHGVSRVKHGTRFTLGVIYHDAE